MRIGVIGADEVSETLAGWWAQAGHDVVIGTPYAAPAPHSFVGHPSVDVVSVADAAAFGDVVLFAPEWAYAQAVLDVVGGALAGKPVLDATNPVVRVADGVYARAVPEDHSGIEELERWTPRAQWVKAFNTLSATVLRRRRGRDPLLTEFICTDSRVARTAATVLIHNTGFAPVFAGGSGNAHLTETGGMLQMREVDVVDATAVLAEALSARS